MVSGISGGFDLTAMVQSIFQKADVNGDGTIGKTELQSFLADSSNVDVDELFTNLDADSDGGISTGEVKSALQKIGEGMHARMGRMQPPDPSEMFSLLDTDGDGSISEEELAAGSPDGNGPGGVSISDFFKSQDTDSDGKISQTEFEAGVKAMEANRPAGGPPPMGMGGPGGAGGAAGKKYDVTALLDALKSSEDDEEEDAIKALFEMLAEKLQNSVNYDQQGNVGLSVSVSTFTITA